MIDKLGPYINRLDIKYMKLQEKISRHLIATVF